MQRLLHAAFKADVQQLPRGYRLHREHPAEASLREEHLVAGIEHPVAVIVSLDGSHPARRLLRLGREPVPHADIAAHVECAHILGAKAPDELRRRQFREQILSGALSAGDALPSMRVLAKELRISVITTKRAYEELEREGFLTTVPGKGCFVAPQNPELVREDTLRRAEEHLSHAVDVAKAGGVTLAELTETLNLLYGDETL